MQARASTTDFPSTIGDSTRNLWILSRRHHVSRFLLFDCDPIDQPAATDPVERLTWCALRIRVGQRVVSRIWDNSLQCERTNLYVPAFPVAEWVVQNWWSLLNELCPLDSAPKSDFRATEMKWIKRHCLRSADSALMLPALYLFHDGRGLRAEWDADPSGSMPNMPGEFVAPGAEQLDSNATQAALEQFVNNTLDRVAGVNDERVRELTDRWRAIRGADVDEQQFCTLAGRMGIDPYDPNEMTDELAEFFEKAVTDPQDPLVRDLTEVARPDSIEQQWSWLTKVSEELRLGPNRVELPFPITTPGPLPHQFGYDLARKVREKANIQAAAPLVDIDQVARASMNRGLRLEDRNHVPGDGVRAIVGRSPSGEVVTAGPQPPRQDSQRFLIARSLYHALVTSQESRRLVTNAYSWDQKASRAFAAELLAPQEAIENRIGTSEADRETVERLSHQFNVSAKVIEKQLQNAGIPLSDE
jgi:hypothetical protein